MSNGVLDACKWGTIEFTGIRSIERMGFEQVRRRPDHPFAVLKKAIAIAAHEFKLMFAAFLVHGCDVFDRMRAGHFRDQF